MTSKAEGESELSGLAWEGKEKNVSKNTSKRIATKQLRQQPGRSHFFSIFTSETATPGDTRLRDASLRRTFLLLFASTYALMLSIYALSDPKFSHFAQH